MGIISLVTKVARASFGDYVNALVLMAAAANLFVLTVNVLNWEIAAITARMVEQFQKVSQFVSFVLIEWWLDVPVPQLLRDAIMLYFILGGIAFRTRTVINRLNAEQPWRENPYYIPPGGLLHRTIEELKRRRDQKHKDKVERIRKIAAASGLADDNANASGLERAMTERLGVLDRIRQEGSFWLGIVAAHLLIALLALLLPPLILLQLLGWPIYVYRRWNLRLLHLTGDPKEPEVPSYSDPRYDLSIATLRFKYVYMAQLVAVLCADLLLLAVS